MRRRLRSDIGQCLDRSRPVLGICLNIRADEVMLEYHAHPRGQLAYAATGILKIHTDAGVWVVPPSQAVWIPGGLRHSVNAQIPSQIRHLFIDPFFLGNLPKECNVLDMTPLLQALIMRVAGFGRDYDIDGPEARLCAVVLDELQALQPSALYLPWANDRRVQRVMNGVIDDFQMKSAVIDGFGVHGKSLEKWALEVGASPRNLSRLFLQETGMTFKQWRQQWMLQEAVSQLGSGKSVTHVALALGYSSPSSFVAMFRKSLGKPPAQYCREIGASKG